LDKPLSIYLALETDVPATANEREKVKEHIILIILNILTIFIKILINNYHKVLFIT